MTDNPKSPLYSLVTFGRNDNYNPDFLYRLQTMLNFNARALEKIGRLDDVEFVVVDWGSEFPLRKALALDAPAAEATVFLELSPEAASRVSDVPNGMHTTRASNTGIRRARGQFVGFQGADLLTTGASWRALLSALEDRHDDFPALSRSVLLVPRRTVPWTFVARQPEVDRWERWLLTCSQVTPEPPLTYTFFPGVGGGMGIIILHRDLWREVNALEESFPSWGYSDNDLVLRVSAHHPWLDAGTYGVVCYKMEHAPHGMRGRLLKGGGTAIDRNRPWITTSLASRYADWGLPHLALEPKKAPPRERKVGATPTGRENSVRSARVSEGENGYLDKDVVRHVSAVLGRAGRSRYAESELEVLHMLSWFGLRELPVNYLEIGVQHHFYVRAISMACPTVDIYVLESEEKDRDGAMHRAVGICESLLWRWGHKGYFRASAGDLRANFEGLERSFVGPFDLEVVILRIEKPGEVDLMLPVLQAIVQGGLLAVHTARADLLNAALDVCGPLAQNAHILRGHSGRTAFLFARGKEQRTSENKDHSKNLPSSLKIPRSTRFGLRTLGMGRRIRRKLYRAGKIL